MIWFIFKPYLKVRVLKWSYSTEMVRIEVVIKFKILEDLNKAQRGWRDINREQKWLEG